MKQKRYTKKGFTLIEMIAVIIILGVASVITTPIILNVIDGVRQDAYRESARNLFNATTSYLNSNLSNSIPEDGLDVTTVNPELEDAPFISGNIYETDDGRIKINMISDGTYCASGYKTDVEVVVGDCYQLDKTAPELLSPAGFIIGSNFVEVITNAVDKDSYIRGYQYSIDGGATFTDESESNTYRFDNLTHNTNYTVVVRVINNNNLYTDETIEITTKKIADPEYAINPIGWAKSAVVTITYPEREPNYVYEYSFDGYVWQTVADPSTTQNIPFNANGMVIGRVSDGTNIISGIAFNVTMIDTSNPVVAISPNSGATYQKTYSPKITVSDIGSGVKASSLKYMWKNSSGAPLESQVTTLFTNGANIASPSLVNGTYYLWVLAEDNVGNKTLTSSSAFKIDNDAPSVPVIAGGNSTFKNTSSTLTITAGTDSTSSVSGVQYKIGTGAWTSYSTALSFTITTNSVIYARTVDEAGNYSAEVSTTVKIDKAAPSCVSSGGSSTWTNSNKTITGTCSDTGGSGCTGNVAVTYSVNTNTTVASPGTVSDAAGNTTVCPANQTVKIDKTAPTCASSGGSATWTNANKTITGTCSDTGGSGCTGNASLTYSANTNTTVASPGTVSDVAGNAVVCPANQTVKIDKTAPTCATSGGSTAWTSGSRTITGTCSDTGGSGCSGTNPSYTFSVNTNTTVAGPGTTGGTSNIVDAAGNTAVCPANQTVKIDKTAPSTPTLTFSGISQTAVTLNWAAFTDAASGYGYTRVHAQKWNGTAWVNEVDINGDAINEYSRDYTDSSMRTLTISNLTPGTMYQFYVRYYDAVGNMGNSGWQNFTTIPAVPSTPTGTTGALSWSRTEGRGYVLMNWAAVTGATRYDVAIFDGITYRYFDVGNVTSFDSRNEKLYPAESIIAGYGDNTRTADIFNHSKTGLDLRDRPTDLYISASGTTYNTRLNYYFRVRACNASGCSSTSGYWAPTLPNRTDSTGPVAAFGTNGSSTPAKTRSTTVTVSDSESGLNTGTLKYVWTTSSTAPSDASFTTSFTNGATLTTPSNLNGTYYLWTMATDNVGNVSKNRSNGFVLDNTKPVITVTPTTITRTISTTAYTDSGVTATDSVSGTLTSSIVTSGTVNSRVAGTYTLTYSVSDVAGNTATATRTVTYNGYTEYSYRNLQTSCSTCYDTCTSSTSSSVSYSCPSGYSLSGSTCYKSTTSTQAANPSYSCSSYGYVLSGTTCYKSTTTTQAATSSKSCPSGYTLNSSGTSCYKYLGSASYSCPSGSSASGSSCVITTTRSLGSLCPTGYSKDVQTTYIICYKYVSKVYSCSSGSLSGSSCYYYASYSTSYSCPSGYTLSGSTCSKTTTTTQPAGVSYSCPSGYTLSGTTCSKTTTTTTGATASYSCPSGYYRSGTTCYRDYNCNPYSCNCSTYWGSWSAWSTTVSTATSTRQVQTRFVTSI